MAYFLILHIFPESTLKTPIIPYISILKNASAIPLSPQPALESQTTTIPFLPQRAGALLLPLQHLLPPTSSLNTPARQLRIALFLWGPMEYSLFKWSKDSA